MICSPVKRKQALLHLDLQLTPRKRARGDACSSPTKDTPGPLLLTSQRAGPSGTVRASPRKAAAVQPAVSPAVRVKTPRNSLAEQPQPREDGGRPKRRAAGDPGHATGTGTPTDGEASPRKRSCSRSQVSTRSILAIYYLFRGDPPQWVMHTLTLLHSTM